MVQLFHIKGGAFVQAKDKVTQTGETVAKGDIQYQAKNIEVKSGALVAAGVNFPRTRWKNNSYSR